MSAYQRALTNLVRRTLEQPATASQQGTASEVINTALEFQEAAVTAVEDEDLATTAAKGATADNAQVTVKQNC